MDKDITTIQVSKDVRDKLKDLGKKGETYDEILKKILRLSK
ncbi:DUF7557 family protein [[Eubacterium] cellulosolvens]